MQGCISKGGGNLDTQPTSSSLARNEKYVLHGDGEEGECFYESGEGLWKTKAGPKRRCCGLKTCLEIRAVRSPPNNEIA
jgi:hypothetical protein